MKVYVRRQGLQDARLAAFAHDIRTPMCCVTGAAQTALLRSRRGVDVEEQVEQIMTAVRAMDRMLSQLCNADVRSAKTRFTRDMLTRELLAMAGNAARDKDQLLSVDLAALDSRTYVCDYAALVRVLSNLLTNAVKYTQPGGRIALSAALSAAHEEADGLWIVFSVRDNGMGMKPEFLERLFVPFERAQESAHLPGRGLGLAIAKRLTERMGGTIGVTSEWGKGTAFHVYVPMAIQAEVN